MTFHSLAFIVAIFLVQLLAACSSPSIPTASISVNANEPVVPLIEPTVDAAAVLEPSAPPLEPAMSEPGDLEDLIAGGGPLDERFFRPLLAIDNDSAVPLPKALPDGAEVSYVLVDLDRGTTIAERNADQLHIPASSAKLATAVVALQRLGPDHRFKTELRITGPIEDGVLKGDLILQGGGDPVLDVPDLLPLIDALARQPVRRIEGRFLIDDTLLPRFTEIEPTQPTEAAYNPGVSALSIAFNRVNLRWRKRGTLAVETVPHLDEASFVSTKSDRLPPSGVQLKQLDGKDAIWQLADKGSRRSKRSLPVKDAGLFAGQTFRDLATLYGIDLPAPERLDRAQESRPLAVHESRPLRELVRDMLWYSNNLVAELIGLATAKTLDTDVDRLDMSAGLVLSELERQLSDLSWDDAYLHNHSGLSSQSRLTPEQLAAILRLGWDNGTLSGLLPGSGWSGTLARRFNGPDHALRIWAKTGSINYVTALGGYLMSSAHGPAAFVIIISDEKARAGYDAQPKRTRAIEKRGRAWKDQAERAMNSIIERWLEQPAAEPADDLYASTMDVAAE